MFKKYTYAEDAFRQITMCAMHKTALCITVQSITANQLCKAKVHINFKYFLTNRQIKQAQKTQQQQHMNKKCTSNRVQTYWIQWISSTRMLLHNKNQADKFGN